MDVSRIDEIVRVVSDLMVVAIPLLIPAVMKWRDSVDEKKKMVVDVAFMAFNKVNRIKKYIPEKQRQNFDAASKFLEVASQEYFKVAGKMPSISDIVRMVGTANALHAEKKIAKSGTSESVELQPDPAQ